MEWETLLSVKRLGQEDEISSLTNDRNAFESDIDKIILQFVPTPEQKDPSPSVGC